MGERCSNEGKSLDETAVITGKAKEGMDLADGRWNRLIENGRNLGRVHSDTLSENHMAEIVYGRLSKDALGVFGVQTVIAESLEDKQQMVEMVIQVGGEDQNVVEEHGDTLAK